MESVRNLENADILRARYAVAAFLDLLKKRVTGDHAGASRLSPDCTL